MYGYRSCYATYDVWDYALVHRVARIVPPFLTEGMPTDSILSIVVADSRGRTLYSAPTRGVPVRATGTDTVPQISGIVVTVGLRPKVAGRLVLGGVSSSRLPGSFLLLIGVTLLAEGTHHHVNKGYIYFAMAFSFAVELLNLKMRKKSKPVALHESQP